MMRVFAIAIVLVLAACTSTHTTVTARTDCSNCHTQPLTTDPVAAPCVLQDHTGYATTCYQCHGTSSWCPGVVADIGPPDFDITSSSHAGWDCGDCHKKIVYDPPTPPVKGDPLTCISCHWHSKDRTDPNHLGKSGYVYGATTCLQQGCHSRQDRQ